jgi:spermidine synthase
LFESQNKRFELLRFQETFSNDIRFFINGGLQFSTVDEYRYHEVLTHPAQFLVGEAQQALILGGGDGLVARELLKYSNMEHITLVDLDHELTDLFKDSDLAKLNNYSLRNPKIQIINQDAIIFLRELKKHKFPLIIIDFPDPYNLHTAKLYTRQFYELVKSVLSPNGILALQSTSPLFNRKSFLCIGNTLEEAGFNILPMKVNMRTFEDWGFYLASTQDSSFKMKTKLENFYLKSEIDTRFLDKQAMKSCINFGKDIFYDREKYRFNDLNRLVLVQYYKDGLL